MENEKFGYSTVIITGASSGIGASFLAYILNLKQKVLICNISRRKPTQFEGKSDCYHFECDLSNREAIIETFPKIEQLLKERGTNGKILLINNSGFGSYGEFQDCDLSKQLNMIDLNVCALVHLTGLMLPLLIEKGGAIINLASVVAFQPSPYIATYAASKSFVLYWSLALREDLKKQAVRVLALCPGPTRTNFFGRAGFDLKDSGQSAEEVVETAWKGLKKDKGFIVVAFRNKVLTCITKFFPLTLLAKVTGIMMNKMRK